MHDGTTHWLSDLHVHATFSDLTIFQHLRFSGVSNSFSFQLRLHGIYLVCLKLSMIVSYNIKSLTSSCIQGRWLNCLPIWEKVSFYLLYIPSPPPPPPPRLQLYIRLLLTEVFQTLHDFILAWGLLIHTWLNALEPVSRSQVCQE